VPLRTFAEYLHGHADWSPRATYESALDKWLPAYHTAKGPFERSDLELLADCFYLPQQEGPAAVRILKLAELLFANDVPAWDSAYDEFERVNARVQAMFDRLMELVDRELFNAWSRRAWEFKEEMQVLAMVFAAKKAGYDIGQAGVLDGHLPGVFRRGFLTRLKRFIVVDAAGLLRIQN